MEYDRDKVDEVTLALLELVRHNKDGMRVWKGFDWATMNRLHEKGYISDPRCKARSVVLSEEGTRLSQQLFEKYFGLTH